MNLYMSVFHYLHYCVNHLCIVLRFAALFQAMLDLRCFNKGKTPKNADHYLNFHDTFQVLLCFPLCWCCCCWDFPLCFWSWPWDSMQHWDPQSCLTDYVLCFMVNTYLTSVIVKASLLKLSQGVILNNRTLIDVEIQLLHVKKNLVTLHWLL